MTLAHAAALYFDGRQEAAKKRVQKLKAAGLVRERPRRVYDPSVLFLSSRAFGILTGGGHLADYPHILATSFERRSQVSDLTIQHELQVMDVKESVSVAVASRHGSQVVEFSTWPLLFQFVAQRKNSNGFGRTDVILKPDAFIRIHEEDSDGIYEHAFFLEVDRSTEPQETLGHKAICYADFYRSGGFAARQGGQREHYHQYPFRVLMAFKNAERRNNTAERLLSNAAPTLRMVWMTTMAELNSDPLGPIWIRPTDYRDAVRNSAYDLDRPRDTTSIYRRLPAREELVQRSARRLRLLDPLIDPVG